MQAYDKESAMVRCLLIEDDKVNAEFIIEAFENRGYQMAWAADGQSAQQRLLNEDWGLVILDRMLPNHFDGLDLLSLARQHGKQFPILVLSALSGLDDRVRGLKAGGDDYLVKPFALPELLARAEALSRRYQPQEPSSSEMTVGELHIDLVKSEVKRQGQVIPLQARELKLLLYLIKNKDQVVTRSMLLEEIWGYSFETSTNITDVQISRLRSKIDKPFEFNYIQTVRGIGYMFSEDFSNS